MPRARTGTDRKVVIDCRMSIAEIFRLEELAQKFGHDSVNKYLERLAQEAIERHTPSKKNQS